MSARTGFKAVTWNVFHGTDVSVLQPVLKKQLEAGVTVFFMQEAGGKDITALLESSGLRTYLYSHEWRMAWLPLTDTTLSGWKAITKRGVRLSDTPYWNVGAPDNVKHSTAARVMLCNKWGLTLDAASFHLPAHIQVADKPENRMRSFKESLATLELMNDRSLAKAFLAGGDTNWDPNTGPSDTEVSQTLLKRDGSLRAILINRSTLGKRREIDYFLLDPQSGIKPVGPGWVADGGGDHKLKGQEFAWR